MKPVEGSGFPTTDWELFAQLRAGPSTAQQDALRQLVTRYWPTVRHYLLVVKRLRGDEAEEVRSAFTADRLLGDTQLFRKAQQQRGRFRNLLVRALENYLIDAARRKKSHPVQSLANAPAAATTVGAVEERSFERTWARTVLTDVLRSTREHLESSGQTVTWQVFQARIAAPAADGAVPVPYDELVREHRLRTPVQASNLLSSAKRVFVRKLKESLAQYADDGQSCEDQIGELRAILCSAAES